MQIVLIAQGSGGRTLEAAIKKAAAGSGFDRLDVAVAYATKAGILTLEKALGGFPPKSRWVVGLDDAITQPEALAYLFALPGAKLRLASLAPQRRFHPKLYCLRQSTDAAAAVSATGSGNMTLHGLRHNGEAAVLLTAESITEVKSLTKQWKALWLLGDEATQVALDAYTPRYKKAKAGRKKVADADSALAVPEDTEPVVDVAAFDGTVATASVAWIDFGKAMGKGRELEMHTQLMPFFKIQKNFATPQKRDFRFGQTLMALPFKKWTGTKGNQMWRINFITTVPGSDVLIRLVLNGKQLTSDRAVKFERLANGSFAVTFLKQGTTAYKYLVKQSKLSGTFGQTSARSYGFY